MEDQSSSICVTSLGVGVGHTPDLVIDRPNGLDGEWIVLCFSTPFWCRVGAKLVLGVPGDCLIHAPNQPHTHGGLQDVQAGFCNDWIHFNGPGAERIVDACGLPVDTIIATGEARVLFPFLQNIQRELYLADFLHKQAVAIQVEAMLVEMTRRWKVHTDAAHRLTPTERTNQQRLTEIRMHVHRSIDMPWSVQTMANLAEVSPHRFNVLYNQFFNVSPIEDLLRTRIAEAKRLLSGTNVSVAEAARICGFGSVYYFSRIFRQRVGVPPSRLMPSKTRGEKEPSNGEKSGVCEYTRKT